MSPSYPTSAFIGGRWIPGEITFPVINPATGDIVGRVADLTPDDVRDAIDSAAAALPAWSARTAYDRAAILHRWGALILADQEPLARLMTAEQGKPLAEARGEVAFGVSFLDWFAEEAKRAYGDIIPPTMASKRYLTLRQAAGVAAAITPWNFPIAMLARKAGAALAAGCTLVVKPAEETPLCALALAKLAEAAGVPPGVFNVVTTSDPQGAGLALCESPTVRVLSFTGSTEVGKLLYRQCAGTVKRLALELGGNAPVLVFDDADLDQAVEGVIAAKFRNAGQTCVCANRIFVQAGIHESFTRRLAERTAALAVGVGDKDGVAVGPLINAEAIAKVERLVSDAVASGARALTGGSRHARGGLFYAPTVLTGVTQAMEIFQAEIFGPVAALIQFETEAEAIRMANAVAVGLAGYVFTRDIGRMFRVVEALDCGIVAVNDGLPSVAAAPFGGMKESGLGREGGHQGLEEYLDTKYVCIGAA